MIKPFEFYFDFASPYTFLAHKEIQKIGNENSIKINYMPILLGGLLKLAGIKAIQPYAKYELKKRTDDAFEKGIFGAPSFIINNKLFWGQDRLEFVLKEAQKNL